MNGLADSSALSTALPIAIRLRTASQVLEVDWEDGTMSAWAYDTLRQGCRCAGCEASRRSGQSLALSGNIALTEVLPYGPGALRFTFSDGHARGIYPYAYLRQLPAVSTPR